MGFRPCKRCRPDAAETRPAAPSFSGDARISGPPPAHAVRFANRQPSG
ncbi:hypothetical protein GNP93_14600 [Paenibacillus validus]|uniref:Uncharacterized protein n=1 Tax=Paenibacillus validus TaxID=44253 RepID=A0A7X2ZCR2_9BACL|nr:hypothetical protein [Paenibacillus validus]